MSGCGEKDELGHEADGDPWWQESIALTFWDEASGLGGFLRVGHEVGQGTSTVWLGALSAEGLRYRWLESALPLGGGGRAGEPIGVDDGTSSVVVVPDDDVLRCRIVRADFEADLAVEDFYPMTNPFHLAATSSLVREFAHQHWEASGRITGAVRVGTSTFEMDGLCHRDHSWGVRKWDTLRTHRWVAGTVGPELSFMGLSWLASDGTLITDGYVHRDGKIVPATALDVLAYVEADGLSCRGGRLRIDLADGTSVALEATAVDGILSLHRNVACVDTVCRVETGTGQRGFCDFETTHNSRDGRAPVELMVGAVIHDGVSQRPGSLANEGSVI